MKMKVEGEYFEKVKVECDSMEGVVQKIDTVMTDIEGFANKDQVTAIEYLEDKLNKFKKRNWEGNIKGIDCKTEVFQPKVEAIKKEVNDDPVCRVTSEDSVDNVVELKKEPDQVMEDPDKVLNHIKKPDQVLEVSAEPDIVLNHINKEVSDDPVCRVTSEDSVDNVCGGVETRARPSTGR
eukprot:GFUD01061861.1.p1 GENE.GFUD01061861.1~~GFUD01061861.1.p1  ORF type:complete len:180 (+),score=67.67 GFUD01061861.1:29-568(+)